MIIMSIGLIVSYFFGKSDFKYFEYALIICSALIMFCLGVKFLTDKK